MSLARAFSRKIIDFVLPPRCAVTGEIVDIPGTLSASSWSKIRFIDRPFCSCCGLPFDFTTEDMPGNENGTLCGGCLDAPPEFDRARSVFVYEGAGREMVLAFKHGDRLDLTPNFTGWLMRTGGALIGESDIVLPVPLHRQRLFQRRYNQSAVLARALALENKKAGGRKMVFDPFILQRIRKTPPQKGLNKTERQKNMQSAFAVSPEKAAIIKNKNLLLIDDVYTSGATLNACTKALKKSGAGSVFVLTLARVLLT